MKPQRILMTADTVGGVWTYALELSQALTKKGLTVALATMGEPLSCEQWQQVKLIPHLEVFESRFKLEWMPEPWVDVQRAGDWLLALSERFGPDVVHLNGFVHGALPWGVPTVMVGHSCVLSWWEAVKGEAAPESWNIYFQAVKRGLQAVDEVVAPSEAMLKALERLYGVSGRVIPNGRSAGLFYPEAKEEFVLAAGRLWDEAKNVGLLAQVASRLPWDVVVAGDGGEELGSVKGLGRLSPGELASWYRRAGIYAFPAKYEPFGLSVLEAALAGCALVLGDIPSLREVWGDAALYVSPGDGAAWVRVLNGLIEDAQRRECLGNLARCRGLNYSVERMVEGYLAVYQSSWNTPDKTQIISVRTP